MRLALPMRAFDPLGKVDLVAHALFWLANRLYKLASVSKHVEQRGSAPRATVQQWNGIVEMIRSGKGLTSEIRAIRASREDIVESLRGHIAGTDTSFICNVARLARGEVVPRKAEVVEARSFSWEKVCE